MMTHLTDAELASAETRLAGWLASAEPRDVVAAANALSAVRQAKADKDWRVGWDAMNAGWSEDLAKLPATASPEPPKRPWWRRAATVVARVREAVA